MVPSHRNILLVLGLALAVSVGSMDSSRAEDKKADAKTDIPAAPKPTPEQQKRIDQLIKQLGSDTFDEREQAQKELEKIGPIALEALRLAAKSPEAEIKRRATDLVSQLEEVLKSTKQLAPKKVHLKLKDVSVVDAVADLSKQSGYPIPIGGDKAKLAERKITLDTGEVSFWEAFDQLCLKAGLVEAAATDAKLPPGNLQVIDGTPKPTPTSYAGAVRVRLVPESIKRKDGVVTMMLEMAIEPRFRQPKVLGAAKVETALDDKGQPVLALEKSEEKPTPTRAPAALKLGEQQKSLKELSGTVMFETIQADKVLAIDDLAKNVGKSVKNDEATSMQLRAYNKKDNGEVTIQVSISKPRPPGGAINIGPNTTKEYQPELRDANGLPYQVVSTPSQGVSINNTTLSIILTINYRPQPGCGDPAELSLISDKRTALSVPFSFKNLKLP